MCIICAQCEHVGRREQGGRTGGRVHTCTYMVRERALAPQRLGGREDLAGRLLSLRPPHQLLVRDVAFRCVWCVGRVSVSRPTDRRAPFSTYYVMYIHRPIIAFLTERAGLPLQKPPQHLHAALGVAPVVVVVVVTWLLPHTHTVSTNKFQKRDPRNLHTSHAHIKQGDARTSPPRARRRQGGGGGSPARPPHRGRTRLFGGVGVRWECRSAVGMIENDPDGWTPRTHARTRGKL